MNLNKKILQYIKVFHSFAIHTVPTYIIGPKPKNGLHYYTILLVNHHNMPFYVISNHTCNFKLRAYVGKFPLDFAVHKLYVICDFALFGLSQCVVKLVLKSCLSSYKRVYGNKFSNDVCKYEPVSTINHFAFVRIIIFRVFET